MAFTYFFRDSNTLEIMVKFLVKYSSGRSNVKIWNPGCASGQEPYTLAILLAENMGYFAFKNVQIHTTDIDISNQFEEKIKNGIYEFEELQRIPENLFKKYFKKVDQTHFQIDEQLRHRMTYKKHDLTTLVPVGENYSLILCKNVLLHLQPEQRIEVFKMFYNSLAEGGILTMEQTQKIPDEVGHLFHPIVTNAQVFLKL